MWQPPLLLHLFCPLHSLTPGTLQPPLPSHSFFPAQHFFSPVAPESAAAVESADGPSAAFFCSLAQPTTPTTMPPIAESASVFARSMFIVFVAELLAADAIGDVIEHWGFRKALGPRGTMLYLHGDAAAGGELVRGWASGCSMSAGAVSTTLTELQRWGVVRRVWIPGERKEFFEAETDFWKMISKVVTSASASWRERARAPRAGAPRC
jgi:hypothetical protein